MAAVKLQMLDRVIEALKAKLGKDLTGVALFGSRARGEGGSSSDWDLFVIAGGLPENTFDRQLALRAILPKTSEPVSMVAKTRREFETTFPPLYLDLAVDGIALYDPEGYMKGKLKEIREILKHAGLSRTRRKNALIWRWRKAPQGRWRIDWSGVYGLE